MDTNALTKIRLTVDEWVILLRATKWNDLTQCHTFTGGVGIPLEQVDFDPNDYRYFVSMPAEDATWFLLKLGIGEIV